jgi:hypothetical protein
MPPHRSGCPCPRSGPRGWGGHGAWLDALLVLPERTGANEFRPAVSAAIPTSDGRREAGSVFCALEASGRVLLENKLELCIADADPVTPGHSLVIPRRHGADGLALHQPEWNAAVELNHSIQGC